MTLTSSSDSPEDIQGSFKRLVTTIRRTTPEALFDDGYISEKVLQGNYDVVHTPLEIEYCSVQTGEGLGVIHALTVGDFLPQRWVSDLWEGIHSAWNIDIRGGSSRHGGVDGANLKFAQYMFSQYLKGQKGLIRVNASRGWVYPGWRQDLLRVIREKGFDEGIKWWDTCMWCHTRPYRDSEPVTLADFGMPADYSHIEKVKALYEAWWRSQA